MGCLALILGIQERDGNKNRLGNGYTCCEEDLKQASLHCTTTHAQAMDDLHEGMPSYELGVFGESVRLGGEDNLGCRRMHTRHEAAYE